MDNPTANVHAASQCFLFAIGATGPRFGVVGNFLATVAGISRSRQASAMFEADAVNVDRNPACILVVEDEDDLRETLLYNIAKEGYRTRQAHNGKMALEQALLLPKPDLILLDVLLPDLLGTDACKQLKREPQTREIPIVLLTACGEESDRIRGFEVGAEDYITKPFSVREVLLRVRGILRRTQRKTAKDEVLRHGEVQLSPAQHRVWVGDREINLSALEFKLLATLMRRQGRVQSRGTLLTDVWGMSAEIETRTIDVHIKRLRHQLGAAGANVETVRGVGYRLRASSVTDGDIT